MANKANSNKTASHLPSTREEAERAGLKPFKKGTSGNPHGRPKKAPDLDKILAKVLSDKENGITNAEHMIRALVKSAGRGNVRAATLLLERTYGKVTQEVQASIDKRITFSFGASGENAEELQTIFIRGEAVKEIGDELKQNDPGGSDIPPQD